MSRPEKCCCSNRDKFSAALTVLILFSLMVPGTGTTQVIPTNESIFVWSDETLLNAQSVGAGTIIRAYDPQGIQCGETAVSHSGTFGLMPVYRDDPLTPSVDEGAEPGDALVFTIDGTVAACSGPDSPVWTHNGDTRKIDLSAEKVFPTTEWVSVWGKASGIGGIPVQPGAVIRVRDPQGVLCGEYTVSSAGDFGLMPVYADDPLTPGFDEGARSGDQFFFEINGESWVGQGPGDPVWTFNGDVINIDLVPDVVPAMLQWRHLSFERGSIRISWRLTVPVNPAECTLWRRAETAGDAKPVNARITRDGPTCHAVDSEVSPGERYEYRLKVGVEDNSITLPLGAVSVPVSPRRTISSVPNPFVYQTTLLFDVVETVPVSLFIYDVRGRLVRRLIDGVSFSPGSVERQWDGRDDSGGLVAQGVFFVFYTAGKTRETVKLVLVR